MARVKPGGRLPAWRSHGLLPALLLGLVSATGAAGGAAGQGLPGEPPIEAGGNAAHAQSPAAPAPPGPDSRWPRLLAAQYTFIEQWQSALTSPYEGAHSLNPAGDHQPTHTIGAYSGWAPFSWAQAYFDVEKFMGAGVSGATGLGGLTNGDVIREGTVGLKKKIYTARLLARLTLPLGGDTVRVERGQDQLPAFEAARRLEFKAGWLSANDDFDRNRYGGSARTQFMNWSLWQNTAWDYAGDTRGYTDGFVLGYISPRWSLKYGMYRMPTVANGQTLETLNRAREQNLELTLAPAAFATVVRLLAFVNTARLGDYRQALANAAATGTVPDIAADAQDSRHKFGFGVNVEQPLADDGKTGAFARLGWNDAHTEDFVFTEVDRLASFGGDLSGARWRRAEDCLGAAIAIEGLSAPHRDYLAAGGSGFLLGDGRLNYGVEQIFETYYRAQWSWTLAQAPIRLQLGPDFQYVQNPGFNRDRGPVRFVALRVHLEY